MLLSQRSGADGTQGSVAGGVAGGRGGQVTGLHSEWGTGPGAVGGEGEEDDKNDVLDSSSNNWIDGAFSDINKRQIGQGGRWVHLRFVEP